MKLSLCTLTCPNWPLDRIIAAAGEYGIGGIDFRGLENEIDVTRLIGFTVHLKETLGGLAAAKLCIPCLCTSVTLLSPAGHRWEEMIEEFHRYCLLAEAAGTPYIRVFGGETPAGMSDDEAIALAHRRLRQLTKMSQSHGCIPLIQTHDQWNSAARMLRLLDQNAPHEAGVLWDTDQTFRAGEAPAETVKLLGEYLRHVHFKDSRRIGERNIPVLLGHGQVPLAECLHALKESGYDGWSCLDTEKRWHTDAPEPGDSVPHFAAYMRQFK